MGKMNGYGIHKLEKGVDRSKECQQRYAHLMGTRGRTPRLALKGAMMTHKKKESRGKGNLETGLLVGHDHTSNKGKSSSSHTSVNIRQKTSA
jgi:hypothetical protein